MDPITLGILAALGKMGEQVIADGYQALKAVLVKKFGSDSDLVTAANKLEQQPDSEARKALLAEEVAAVKADQDLDIQEALDALMKQLDASAAQGSQINVTITGGSVQGIVGAEKVDVQEMNFGMPPRDK